MSARKFLDLLESQHLLDDAIIADLRRQVDESKRAVNAETIAKLLVDNGHLTKFQATKLVGDLGAAGEEKRSKRKPDKQKPAAKRAPAKPQEEDDLGLADDDELLLEEGGAKSGDGLEPLDDSGGLQPLDEGGLEPLDDGGGRQPTSAGAGRASPQQLQPLGGGGLEPLDGGGASLDPMDAADPVAEAADTEKKKERKGPKKLTTRDNIWDSPLLLVGGGGLLLLLIAGTFLYLSLTRGSAADYFAAAEEDYRSGSYTQAIDKYQKYLKTFPTAPEVSLAKVRIGMSHVRTAVEHSSDPQKALETARETLPTIVGEESFDTARPELATLLPSIAMRFAERADDAGSIAEAEQLLAQVDEAMSLVNDASYIPTSERKNQQVTIDNIMELKGKVEREIGRNKALEKAVADIGRAVNADDTAQAYQVRKQLLQAYPGLETEPSLVSAVDEITARARGLVATEPPQMAVETEEASQDQAVRVLLAGNGGRALPGADNHVALAKVDGAVYGVDAASGRVLWRRFVGHDTQIHPQPLSADPGADALVADGSRNELLRLKAADGSVVWRLLVGEPFNRPVISADEARVLLSTRSGRVLEVDTASGAPSTTAKIPQELTVGPGRGDARRPMIYQVADHDNLYVLNNDDLVCQQVYHLGHRSGTVQVPVVMGVGHIFVAVNSKPGRSELHVLAGNEEGLELTEAQPPLPLEGNVISPLMITGRRIVVVTDLGQVNVFDIAPQKEDAPPVSYAVTAGVATFSQPTRSYSLVDNLRMWIGDTRLTHYEIQTAKGELVKVQISNQGDAFVGPMQHVARGLIHLRKPQGSPGVTMRAVEDRDIDETIWFTELGVPASRVVVEGSKIYVVSGRGRLYPITSQAVQQGFALPAVPPEGDDVGHYFRHSQQLGSGEVLLINQRQDLLVMQPASGELQRRRIEDADGTLSAEPQAMGDGLLLPLSSGRVMYIGAAGQSLAHPFQPQLEAGGEVQWRRPAVVADDKFVIADGRRTVYLVGINTRGAKHLGAIEQKGLQEDIVTPLAAAGGNVWGAIRGSSGDVLVSFAADTLDEGPQVELSGRVTFGPQAVGDDVLVASTGDGLVCLAPDGQRRWQLPLASQLAGAPARDGETYLLATVDGLLLRVDAASGRPLQRKQLTEPLHGGPLPLGSRVLASGADGTLLVATLEDSAAPAADPASDPAEATAAAAP